MPTVQVSCEEEYLDLGLPALDTPPSSGEQLSTQLQFRPLQFSNQHYDSGHTNTNWSPDQVTFNNVQRTMLRGLVRNS